MPDRPVACSLTPDALLARRKGLLADVLRSVESQELTEDGMRLRFAAKEGMLPALAQAIEAERHCCRFLRFSVTVEPDGGPVTLELTGPRGTREFLDSLLETPTSIG